MSADALLGTLLAGPSDGEEFTVVSVSPGLPGFIAMFLLAVVVVLLVVDMTRRVRRVQADARVAERMRAREQAGAAEPGRDLADTADADGASDGSEDPAPAADDADPADPDAVGPEDGTPRA